MPLHDSLVAFRLASRQLFNDYFRRPAGDATAWEYEERFGNVEEELFRMLVTDPEALPDTPYQEPQAEIRVRFRSGLLRELFLLDRSGSWDESACPPDAELEFEAFFDWNQVGVKDYQYVRVRIASCPSSPGLTGMQALIESLDVVFVRLDSSSEA